MSLIRPFCALRPVPAKAKQVSSVPYDVVHESEVRGFIAANPLSFLRITRPEGEAFDKGVSPAAIAKQNLDDLITAGVLVADDEPAYFVYRLETPSHAQTGIVACCSLDEYEKGRIKKHEKTRPDKVNERTEHMLGLRAQTGLIFLAYRETERIKAIVDKESSLDPLYDFEGADTVRQTVWKVHDTQALTDAFGEVDALYIADGHHRAESALLARNALRDRDPDHTGNEDYNFVMAGIFPADRLQILAYNRVVKGIDSLTDDEIITRISESFIVTAVDDCTPKAHGEICMYLAGKWYDLQFSVNYFRAPDPIERLDVSILQQFVLGPALGITDPQTDERIGFVGGIHGTEELKRIVDSGEARIAFSLFPTTIDDLLAVSDMGEIMPPKSTWFEPKLKDGLFVHLI
ncbi:MAG: DUF1015 domain-containing protein [Blastocatellia bacterium]|nr:DUF1015 domain-containing protein [Chloracidobacterium sp.]MBL8183897.1 DUF1015 domain-containing protein [Blastocatellia bacterium]HBE81664.1 DUF1015 domain-containing protein [Blastocatellia bacterium]HRJ87972.1 DUF1015 family protein [Pyrinomonadaceae bacterium]HRK49717.1 DUF1015 family protein [Pyrinomonadaceae bacterium]